MTEKKDKKPVESINVSFVLRKSDPDHKAIIDYFDGRFNRSELIRKVLLDHIKSQKAGQPTQSGGGLDLASIGKGLG